MKPQSPEPPAQGARLPTAAADEGSIHAKARRAQSSRLPIFGVGVDAGVPDGLTFSVIARPLPRARVQLGMGSNGISWGLRTGATWLPLRAGPAAIFEYGHYHEGNANAVAGTLIGSSFRASPLFDRVGYDYWNLHLGMNYGYQRVAFFVQGGLSIVRGEIHNADRAVREAVSSLDGTQVAIHGNPSIKAIGFGAKLGLIAYVW
jgi:hypothetical protein